jgi:hypothetical protein
MAKSAPASKARVAEDNFHLSLGTKFKCLIDFLKASTLPTSSQNNMCDVVSFSRLQLGHFRLVLSQGLLPLAGAKSMTCLHAHIWNILGTSLRALLTIFQSTASKPSLNNILASWKNSLANCLWTQNFSSSPLSLVNLFPPSITYTGSK